MQNIRRFFSNVKPVIEVFCSDFREKSQYENSYCFRVPANLLQESQIHQIVALAKLKNIENIIIRMHSDCAGAKLNLENCEYFQAIGYKASEGSDINLNAYAIGVNVMKEIEKHNPNLKCELEWYDTTKKEVIPLKNNKSRDIT